MGVHGAFKRADGSVHMHNPQNLLRMSLKPTPVSLAVEKQRAKQGFAQGGAAKSLGKGGEAPSVPAEYVANLQQQIFFLERKLEVQAQGGLGGMGGLGGGAASALPGGEPVSGLRGHFQQLEAEFGAKLRTHEAQVEALTQQRVAAQLGEQRAVQLVAEADARVEAAGHRLSEARQELTAEVVGLQKELDSASLAHKSTREELKELSATCAELKTFTHGARSEVRRLESKLAHEMHETTLSFQREEAMRKELFATKQAHEALLLLYEGGVAKWDRRESEMLKAKDAELAECFSRTEKAELSRRDAEARAEALSARLDEALRSESLARSRAADAAKQARAEKKKLSYAESDRDAAVAQTERNKMVSVMSRMIIRKTRERMLAATAAYDRVQAGEDALNERVVRAEELKKAIDFELAQERQRHDMVAEHYRRQDADAVAMTALNRELESRLAEAASRAAELTSALRAAELRERQSAARLKTLESRADLARLLADLKVDDLRALAETQSGVTRAITERLLPALSMALPALASEASPDTEPPTPVAVSAAPSRATASAVAPAATAVPASA